MLQSAPLGSGGLAPFLDHVVLARALLPAAAMLDALLAASTLVQGGASAVGGTARLALTAVAISRPVLLGSEEENDEEEEGGRCLQVTCNAESGSVVLEVAGAGRASGEGMEGGAAVAAGQVAVLSDVLPGKGSELSPRALQDGDRLALWCPPMERGTPSRPAATVGVVEAPPVGAGSDGFIIAPQQLDSRWGQAA